MTKHTCKIPPPAPTADQSHAYHMVRKLKYQAAGIQYNTGPRYGQQFADRTPSGRIGVAKYLSEQAKVKTRGARGPEA